jgi:heme/copper-type cytochrome/quinol oxidase subunit 2
MSSIPSVAAQVLISIIPIVGIVMGCVVVFFYLLWSHRERMRLIEQGTYTPRRVDLEAFSFLAGLLLSGVGLVLSILFIVMDGVSYSLLGGLIPLAVGAALICFFALRRPRAGE